MLTKFRRNLFGLESIYTPALMLMAYLLFCRDPYVQSLDIDCIFQTNVKKMFGFMFNGVDAIMMFGISVAMVVSVVDNRLTREMKFHNSIKLDDENVCSAFVKRGYDEYLLNLLNPFLLGSKTLELRE